MTPGLIRPRKAIWLALIGGLIVLLLLSWGLGATTAPLDVSLIGTEASSIYDEEGKEFLLLFLQVSNRSAGLVWVRDEQQVVQSEVEHRWRTTENRWSIGLLSPGGTKKMVLLVPVRTKLCRLSLAYQREPLQTRLWRLLGPNLQQRLNAYLPKRAAAWVWPNFKAPNDARWRKSKLEFELLDRAG